MPVQYFKCACGEEHREIVPLNHDGYRLDPRSGRWVFTGQPAPPRPPAIHTCEQCGQAVTESSDPKAVRTKFLFNYMEP